MNVEWTTPEEIRAQVRQDWERGRILAGRLVSTSIYPKAARFKRPDSKALGARFGEVQDWIAELVRGSRGERGRGYDVEWEEFRHQQLGRNRVPARVIIPSDEDAAFLIGKLQELKRWDHVVITTIAKFPALKPWFERRPLAVLDAIDEWDQVLSVLSWFIPNPHSGLYLRQLDIAGVDTKFIESRRALFEDLLGILVSTPQQSGTKREAFEARFGLREKPIRVRFRFLDPELHLGGLSDIEADAIEFARHPLPVDRVFIVENEVNFLSFPAAPRALIIWGEGYAIDRIRDAAWLGSREVAYWGDIDTHGFGILDRLRSMFPSARSLLMDRETFLEHQKLWVVEPKPRVDQLARLTEPESALYDDIRHNRLGQYLRLEQERVRFTRVVDAVSRIEVTVSDGQWLEAAQTRNWLLGDPLLDWLERFGFARGFEPDERYPDYDPSLDFDLYVKEHAQQFREAFIHTLAAHAAVSRVVQESDAECAAETVANMRRGVEVVVGGVLSDARRRVHVRPDLVMRADVAASICPSIVSPHRENAPLLGSTHYVPVFVAWRKLVLDRDARFAAIRDNLPLVVDAWLACQALGELQGLVPDAFVVGRPHAEASNQHDVARVSFERDEEPISSLAAEALAWLRRLNRSGAEWAATPMPSVPELYPHARNRSSGGWSRAKRRIGHELKELTLLPGISPQRRRIAHAVGIYEWSDSRASASALGLGESKAAERCDAVLRANRDREIPFVPGTLDANAEWRARMPVEFFVDFETAHDDEEATRRIAMIGCGHHDGTVWRFHQWIANSLSASDERLILDRWLDHMRGTCDVAGCDLTSARLFHWSHAERTAFATTFLSARLRHTPNDWPESLPWFDLLAVFREVPVGVTGAFDYGLKSIAKAMHAAGLIETQWQDASLDGLTAMVGLMRAAESGLPLPDNAIVQRIARYNETDCRSLMEILHWLRTNR